MSRQAGIAIFLDPRRFETGADRVEKAFDDIGRAAKKTTRTVGRGFDRMRADFGVLAANARAIPRSFAVVGREAQSALGGAVTGALAAATVQSEALASTALALPMAFQQSAQGVRGGLSKISQGLDIVDAEFRVIPDSIGLIEDKTKTLGPRMRGVFSRIGDAVTGFGRRVAGLAPVFGNMARAANRRIGSLDGIFRRVQASVFSLRTAIIGLGVTFATRSIVNAGLSMERIELALSAVSDSSENAADNMRFVDTVADTLGLQLQTTAKAYAQLTASARGTALEGAETRNIFLGVTQAARALGLSADDTSGAIRAISQVMSKGTVQAEELRGQLGERIPGAFQIAAKAMGVTTRELGKMLERGEVLATDLLPKMARELSDRFTKGATEAAKGTVAAFARLETAFFRFQATIARSGVNDALGEISETLSALFNDMVRDGRAAQFGEALGNAIRGVGIIATKTADAIISLQIGLNEFFAQISNRIAAFMEGVSFDEVNKLFEREQLAQLRGELEGGAGPSIQLSVPPIEKGPSAPETLPSEFDELIQSLERQIRLNRDLTDAAGDGVSAQNALTAAFEAEQAVAKLDIQSKELQRKATERLTDKTIELLESERMLRDTEDEIARQRERDRATDQTIADLEFERRNLVRLSEAREDGVEAYEAERSAVNASIVIRRLGIDTLSLEADKIRELIEEIDRLAQNVERPVNAIRDAFVSAVGNMEDALVDFVTTGKLSFEDLANSILRDVNRIFIRNLITQPLANAFSGQGDAGIFGGLQGLFGGGAPQTAATGGVFNAPFIGGEAGPEAAVPLPDGRNIPVKMLNGTQNTTTIHLTLSPVTPDVRAFEQSERQILTRVGNQLTRALQRNRG